MALTYQSGSGNFETAGLTVNGDGTATMINVPLSDEPFKIGFVASMHPPSAVSVPMVIETGSTFYTVTTTYNTTTFVISFTIVSQVGSNPLPNGTQIVIPITFIYSGT